VSQVWRLVMPLCPNQRREAIQWIVRQGLTLPRVQRHPPLMILQQVRPPLPLMLLGDLQQVRIYLPLMLLGEVLVRPVGAQGMIRVQPVGLNRQRLLIQGGMGFQDWACRDRRRGLIAVT
jgi:hypothetical protein